MMTLAGLKDTRAPVPLCVTYQEFKSWWLGQATEDPKTPK
jgi:hypothetical protein